MSAILEDLRSLQTDSYTANTRVIGHHDLNGHGDGMQLIKHGQYLYVAHLGTSDMALSILDCADPTNPKLVRQIPHPPNTHRHKVQIAGNVLIQNSEVPYFRRGKYATDEKPVTGLCVFDLSDPTDPQQVGFHPVPSKGVHRIWYSEPPYAHIAAHIPEVHERAYQIVDLSNPREPRMAGGWWIPGTKDGDPEPWELPSEHAEFHVHGIIPHGNRAYLSGVDAGFVLLDISNVSSPQVLGRLNWFPPYGGYLHTALPLPSRGLVVGVTEAMLSDKDEPRSDKRVWLIDVRNERQLVTISSFAQPQPPRG